MNSRSVVYRLLPAFSKPAMPLLSRKNSAGDLLFKFLSPEVLGLGGMLHGVSRGYLRHHTHTREQPITNTLPTRKKPRGFFHAVSLWRAKLGGSRSCFKILGCLARIFGSFVSCKVFR